MQRRVGLLRRLLGQVVPAGERGAAHVARPRRPDRRARRAVASGAVSRPTARAPGRRSGACRDRPRRARSRTSRPRGSPRRSRGSRAGRAGSARTRRAPPARTARAACRSRSPRGRRRAGARAGRRAGRRKNQCQAPSAIRMSVRRYISPVGIDVEDRQALDAIGVVERHPVRAARAAVVPGDGEALEAQPGHDGHLVARHRALGVGLVVGRRRRAWSCRRSRAGRSPPR